MTAASCVPLTRVHPIEAAVRVTAMTMVKHPFRSGFKAQAGIEF